MIARDRAFFLILALFCLAYLTPFIFAEQLAGLTESFQRLLINIPIVKKTINYPELLDTIAERDRMILTLGLFGLVLIAACFIFAIAAIWEPRHNLTANPSISAVSIPLALLFLSIAIFSTVAPDFRGGGRFGGWRLFLSDLRYFVVVGFFLPPAFGFYTTTIWLKHRKGGGERI